MPRHYVCEMCNAVSQNFHDKEWVSEITPLIPAASVTT